MNGPELLGVVDAEARIRLPHRFAGATVTFEAIGDSEIIIRKREVDPDDGELAPEDVLKPLSNEDRDFFLNLLENPPEPNEAFRNAVARYKARYESDTN